jgi:hypothetical protein
MEMDCALWQRHSSLNFFISSTNLPFLDSTSTMGRRGPKGSPRLRLAAYELATKENIDPEAALLSAGYKRADVTHSKLQAVSKQKCRIKNALRRTERHEIRRGYYIKTKAKGINDGSTSGISSVTDPTSEAINNKSSLELESTHASAAQSAPSNFTTKASVAL